MHEYQGRQNLLSLVAPTQDVGLWEQYPESQPCPTFLRAPPAGTPPPCPKTPPPSLPEFHVFRCCKSTALTRSMLPQSTHAGCGCKRFTTGQTAHVSRKGCACNPIWSSSSSIVLHQLQWSWQLCWAARQGNRDGQAVSLVELLQAELLHAAEPDEKDGEHGPEHGVCHPALLPAVPVRAHPPRQAGAGPLHPPPPHPPTPLISPRYVAPSMTLYKAHTCLPTQQLHAYCPPPSRAPACPDTPCSECE